MLSEVRFDHMRLLRSEAQNWGGRRGHPKMIWHPPWQTRRPPKLLGAIFEKIPPDPSKLALRAPPWKFPFLRPCPLDPQLGGGVQPQTPKNFPGGRGKISIRRM